VQVKVASPPNPEIKDADKEDKKKGNGKSRRGREGIGPKRASMRH